MYLRIPPKPLPLDRTHPPLDRLQSVRPPFGGILKPLKMYDFQHPFEIIWLPFCIPTWLPKPRKIDRKSILRYLRLLLPFFWIDLLVNFCSQLRPPKRPKSLLFYLFYNAFSKMRLSKLTSIFGAILIPTCLHFASQNPPKTFKNQSQKASKIFVDFRSI